MTARKIIAVLLAASTLTAAEMTDSKWADLRTEARAKPRRVIINNDGCDVTEYPATLACTRENIYKQMMDKLKGCEIDTVTYCPFAVGHVLATRSLVAEMHLGRSIGKNSRNLLPEILAMGTDPMQLAVEFCRANNFEIFASMRVNDHHDQWFPQLLSEFKRKNPSLLFGTPDRKPPYGSWTGFDFAQSVVRNKFTAIVNELVANYDVDGIELDFYRFPTFFKSVAWGGVASPQETEEFTSMMRNIRKNADRVGKKRGRYEMIAVRVPDSPELCRAIGLDVDTWMKENLIDLLFTTGDAGRFDTYANAIAMGHKHGIKVYPSIDTSWMTKRGPFNRNDMRAYLGQSAAIFAAGADGIYYFNMFYAPGFLPQMRRNAADFTVVDKLYQPRYHNISLFSSQLQRFNRLANRCANGTGCTPGHPAEVLIETGDDFTNSEVMMHRPEVKFFARTFSGNHKLRASVNGHELPLPVFADDVYEFTVDPATLRKGENSFVIRNDATEVREPVVILSGTELLKGVKQPPWRRLFAAHDFANSEIIVNGAYRLADTGSGATDIANLLYPLPELKGVPLKLSFDMKLESSTKPEAVVCRVADGANVEVVTFEPDKIGLKFASKTKRFETADRFHHYVLEFVSGRVRLSADGQMLFDEPLAMKATDSAGRMHGNSLMIPYMNERSLVLGSLSGTGTGAALWKNTALAFSGVILADAALSVKFRGKPDEKLEKALAIPVEAVKIDFTPHNATLPKIPGLTDAYQEGFRWLTPDNTLLLNNDCPKNAYQLFRITDFSSINEKSGILFAAWRVRVLPPTAKSGDSLFQMVLSPAAGEEMTRLLAFRFFPGYVLTPWGRIKTPEGWIDCRAAVNLTTGKAAAVIGGREISGEVRPVKGKPMVFWGDGSSDTSGKAELEYVKIGILN